MAKKALCIMSGGMDSTLCAYIAKNWGFEVVGLHFDYSQRTMRKEKESFLKICDALGVESRVVIDASFISKISSNSITDMSLEVPKDGLSEFLPNTYVPFRNGIFLSIAGAVAESSLCEAIFIGVTDVDSSGYPDCSAKFIEAMQGAINTGSTANLKIYAPLANIGKKDIVKKAVELGVRLDLTWSCYESESVACGKCDSCLLRLKGFEEAGEKDQIPYKI